MANFSTKDIYIAATLIAIGHTNYSVKKEGNVAFFIFENDGNIEDRIWETAISVDADEYYSENYEVVPKKLYNAFKELKGRLYN
jgi:hypothetical protein